MSRLTEGALVVLREHGFAGLTVRLVAAQAGVAPATAYTYFSSKEHLIAEVFWRRLSAMERDAAAGDDRATRVVHVLRSVALLVSDEPELAAGVTAALLGRDPDVEHLRMRIGVEIRQRLLTALGCEPGDEQDLLEALEMLYAGALLRAGMGYGSYLHIADRLEVSARMVLSTADGAQTV